jgi:HK97 family phage prohead protease
MLYALAEVKAVDSDSENGEFEVILSMPTLDRDDEVIDAKAFEPLPDSIPFHAFHDFTQPVGRAAPAYDGDRLVARGFYASTPDAQLIRAKVAEGVIGHTSVGFMAPKREVVEGKTHIVKAELLEGSFVSVPSNREAAVLAAKSMQAKVGARNSATDLATIQSIHDAAATLGADCESKGVERAFAKSVDGKELEGSYEQRREQLRQAIRSAHPDAWWTMVLATFDDSVVYEVETSDGAAQFQASYEITDGVVTLGTAEPVEVTEVVQPAKATDPEKAAAPAAASPADVSLARLAAAEAELLLLD